MDCALATKQSGSWLSWATWRCWRCASCGLSCIPIILYVTKVLRTFHENPELIQPQTRRSKKRQKLELGNWEFFKVVSKSWKLRTTFLFASDTPIPSWESENPGVFNFTLSEVKTWPVSKETKKGSKSTLQAPPVIILNWKVLLRRYFIWSPLKGHK